MAKKVTIGGKPTKPEVEQWVANRDTPASDTIPVEPVKMKRLTLDIPESLHAAIKRRAVDEGVTMADMLRKLLEEHYVS
jgi:predicted DNA binding CopG/RHH family protein